MSEVKKTKVHLISGFLGTGKTTALKSLMEQKDTNEKLYLIHITEPTRQAEISYADFCL